ncbi:3-hydroxyacyl-CoA dehydrogenase family protein [Nonomuraea sp. NEAU-A123]|uniref:3-hydroxyacyl-CoA dehydrogenase family protein n=1 Tax=Nonomuraea sp. NEAU-A123 TaxID=2839649 RepID=UPI001BE4B6F6|nr:3-hydroxyacyl-CoA dehydrogenase family protein [Nonomuraea sp. NEAU-A123]MBT2227966.1 3-hydroxyacyl-CoA dehydrogenase family protein [Nonomuraea sp. NEAU-A123]
MIDHPRHVTVIGGGTMGCGIAGLMAVAGSAVTVIEVDRAAADRVAERVHREWADDAGALTRLDTITDVMRTPPETDLVIEAVAEDAGLKAEVLAAAGRAAPHAILATNTSSISISRLARAVHDPGRFLGLHFFNPVTKSALIEIVTGDRTAPQTVELARNWSERWQRTPIVVRDSPGFATSRLGVLLGLEAIRMVEEGVADPHDIDAAMVLGYRHPIGPLRLTDLVGLDVRLAIADYLSAELGDRFSPPRLLREKVGDGLLGRKTGQGFYSWTAKGRPS